MKNKEMSLEEALAARETARKQVEQKAHQLQRDQNRQQHMRKKKDRERTHHLCERAGMLEAIAPGTKQLSCEEFYRFMDTVFSYPMVSELLNSYLKSHTEGGGSV